MSKQALLAAEVIKKTFQVNHVPFAMILGSGLSALCEKMQIHGRLSYKDLPGYHQCSVVGHEGEMIYASLNGQPLLCLSGRAHYYEGVSLDVFRTMIRSLHLLGVKRLLITNSSGTLNPKAPPGTLMVINDHINFQGTNPLMGDHDESFGPRFLSLDDVYDSQMRQTLHTHAKALDIPLSEGVYIGTQGPIFETHAEIRAFRMWGADAVGMSTLPEVICAHQCGIRLAVLAVLTNWAAGMGDEHLSHELTISGASQGSSIAQALIHSALPDLMGAVG